MEEPLFSGDRPIVGSGEDLLGRSSFAHAIARAIAEWRNKDSLVVGLCGPWGSGKTSIKNMVLEMLQQGDGERPLVIDFNPWQWSGAGDLSESFFREVGTGLGVLDRSKEGRDRANKWRRYALRLKVITAAANPLPGWIRKVLACFVGFLAGSGSSITFSKLGVGFGLGSLAVLGALCVTLMITNWLENICAAIAAALGFEAGLFAEDIAQLKVELAESLMERTAPVVVVMDDIDRLSAREIRHQFQTVKANADFPNVVYFLSFDRDVVAKALEEENSGNGGEYLAKIVQVPFEVPLLDKPRLEKVLFGGLDRILEETGADGRFDQHRWNNLYVGGLRGCFHTLRDVKRFLSTFSFHASLFCGERAFEVNPVDLIALEALRMTEPQVYRRLPSIKYSLTERKDRGVFGGDDQGLEAREDVEAALGMASEHNREAVREVVSRVFPSVGWAFSGKGYVSGFEEDWFRELRVCHPQVFDRYFQFAIPHGDVSQSEIQGVISRAGNRRELVVEFRRLNERGLLGAMLDRLEAYKTRMDIAHATSFVTALMDVGDELPLQRSSRTHLDAGMQAERIIHWYLLQESDPGRRAALLREAVEETTGLYLAVMMIADQCDTEGRKKSPESFLVEEEDVEALRALGIGKIEGAAARGGLEDNAHLESILWRWYNWGRSEQAREWVSDLMDSREGALNILVTFIREISAHHLGDHVAKVRWEANIQGLERLVPVAVIERAVAEVQTGDLTPEQERAVSLFTRAIEQRKAGKPDSDWPIDEVE